MRIDRKTIIACVLCVFFWNWATTGGRDDDTRPRPLDDRPVLRWIAKAARTLLWISLAAEGPPKPETQRVDLVHARTGDDGQPMLDHGRGW